MNPENVLELWLGGNYESLSARLQKPPPGSPRRIVMPSKGTVPPKGKASTLPPPQPEITLLEPEPKVAPRPRRKPQPRPEFHVVTLAEGQTLYGLCRTELGSGARWKDVAALNGWSESRAANLPAGQKVKLPVR